MKHWAIGKRIMVGFAAIILIALALGAFAYGRLQVIRGHSQQVAHLSIPVMELTEAVEARALYNVNLVYKHVGAQSAEDRAQLEKELKESRGVNSKVYEQLEKLLAGAPLAGMLDQVKTARGRYSKALEATLVFSGQSTNRSEPYRMARSELEPALKEYLATVRALSAASKTQADTASQQVFVAVQS